MSNVPAQLANEMETAKVLAASDLLPSHLRNKPQNVLLVSRVAQSLGIDPMAALTQINVIDGKPTLGAALQAALVRRAGHKLHVRIDEEAMTATAELRRCDDPETVHHSVWTQEKAERAGLWGKGAWQAYPSVMLANRATTEVIRLAASDVLLGAAYSPDELGQEPSFVDLAVDDDIETTDAEVVEE